VDLGATADVTTLAEVFDFARDYLGLLKAAVIAAGIVPPGIEGSGQSLEQLLARVVGPGRGLEIVSNVNNIPKGSRLAVSTTLLASLISVLMRATGQAQSLEGQLQESERRVVLARALLGEWLSGSGGGWQDSGGLWPSMKLICGALSQDGDPELGISRGRLMPTHRILDANDAPTKVREELQDCLILVHGGMAQNVGPILEMVTEKYLLRSDAEWKARQEAIRILDEILAALRSSSVRDVGALTTRNFFGPIQTIIPWASNFFTETLVEHVRASFGEKFWGFWMLGGMSGGGMGFIFAPARRREGQARLQEIMLAAKRELQAALPFAMDPVVYDFAINEHGSTAALLAGADALLPAGYYQLTVPRCLRQEARHLTPRERADLQQFTQAARSRPEFAAVMPSLLDRMLPAATATQDAGRLDELLTENGFDRAQHEQICADLRNGRIGLAMNRLPPSTRIEDVPADALFDAAAASQEFRRQGEAALRAGEVAVVTYAAGVGSRWTQGAGVVKGLHPFATFGGAHRNFIEVHLAKTRRTARAFGGEIPHVFTTSYLTHTPIERFLRETVGDALDRTVWLSPGRSIGLRLVPTVRDLHFAWEETAQQKLDEQQEKMRESVRTALTAWARQAGEGSDYTDNLPGQCLHPVGHWFEIPNLLKNGVLARLLAARPGLRTLLVHNIDTLGATADPALLGWSRAAGATLGWEVMAKRVEDHGGGLARIDGRVRLVEGLALPREEDEFALTWYSTNTCWVDIDRLLTLFGLSRGDLANPEKTATAVRTLAARMPTYVTLKDVKKRWGHGQEDVYPVAQFEKLWGDMTALAECANAFAAVPRARGQQLKDQAQLDVWQRDGSAAYIETLGDWAQT
jgi:hypothetical protein